MMKELSLHGFNVVLMHFRGSGDEENLLPRLYHSGDTGDALEFIHSLHKKYPHTKLHAIGYSLGANMLLKLLGEEQEKSLLSKAVAVSPPMQLEVCADAMNRGFSRYYQHRLLKNLKSALDRKYIKHDMQSLLHFKRSEIKTLKTFWQYDDVYTAPIHGFSSADDYYKQCSSKQYLKDIRTPTLIIHAKDDPFMTPEVIPSTDELSSDVTLEVSEKGGHVGFVSGTIFQPKYWLEGRIRDYFLEESIS